MSKKVISSLLILMLTITSFSYAMSETKDYSDSDETNTIKTIKLNPFTKNLKGDKMAKKGTV